jgi:NAD(P)-dependent dehydrogenase (short-subunit alcohol dehydrogenase family)
MSHMKVALVTGASSGFGQLTAARLAASGYRVFGTSRKAQTASPSSVEMLVLDVRSDESVQACAAELLRRAGRIDLLVNNAGQTNASLAEETDPAQARDVLETNFWGAVRVTNAVLPIMRKQRGGHIINVSSLAGLLGTPGQAFYSASKFALEGYSEALSIELQSFNIHVTLVEPGFFNTGLHAPPAPSARQIPDYDSPRSAIETSVQQSIVQGGDPQAVAEAIVRVAASRSPKLRTRVGSDAVWVPRLKAIVPSAMFDAQMRKRFGL